MSFHLCGFLARVEGYNGFGALAVGGEGRGVGLRVDGFGFFAGPLIDQHPL